MTIQTEEKDTARSQAKAQLESITEMMERLEHARECTDDDCTKHDDYNDRDDYHDEELALLWIQEDPLEVSVRSDWHSVGEAGDDSEFLILLCTGGPACRITGELTNEEPTYARLQYQDWGTPWTQYIEADQDILLEYAKQFIFAQ